MSKSYLFFFVHLKIFFFFFLSNKFKLQAIFQHHCHTQRGFLQLVNYHTVYLSHCLRWWLCLRIFLNMTNILTIMDFLFKSSNALKQKKNSFHFNNVYNDDDGLYLKVKMIKIGCIWGIFVYKRAYFFKLVQSVSMYV